MKKTLSLMIALLSGIALNLSCHALWSAVGQGINRQAAALSRNGSNPIAKGEFNTAGGNPANFIAVYGDRNLFDENYHIGWTYCSTKV